MIYIFLEPTDKCQHEQISGDSGTLTKSLDTMDLVDCVEYIITLRTPGIIKLTFSHFIVTSAEPDCDKQNCRCSSLEVSSLPPMFSPCF